MYIRRRVEFKFGLFMLAIEDGGNFDKSFRATYGLGIDETWQDFVDQLREKQREMPFADTVMPHDRRLSRTVPVSLSLRIV